MAANKERTFIAIKPDGVQRGLIGKIVQRFEERGFKVLRPSKETRLTNYSSLH